MFSIFVNDVHKVNIKTKICYEDLRIQYTINTLAMKKSRPGMKNVVVINEGFTSMYELIQHLDDLVLFYAMNNCLYYYDILHRDTYYVLVSYISR